MDNIIIVGSGGHAKVIADIILKTKNNIIGFLDDNRPINSKVLNIPVIGKINEIKDIVKLYSNTKVIVAIGNNNIRKEIMEKYSLDYYIAIHPSAQISIDVEIGKGTVVMANAVINASSNIGKGCIINTGAVIEHDNHIENYVHISPNATLSGSVKIGTLTHLGSGSIVKNNVSISKNNIIGAGTVVINDIFQEESTFVGVPAKLLEK